MSAHAMAVDPRGDRDSGPPTDGVGPADDVRAWAEERCGPLDSYREEPFEIVWRAYDLPA